jgi:hypothetical protein
MAEHWPITCPMETMKTSLHINWLYLTTLGLGESTLQGGHFGHFHDMYIKYIFAKCIAFNFGVFSVSAWYFDFQKVNDI